MVPVSDFQIVDKIFPGTPGEDSSKDLAKLHRMRFQVIMHRMEKSSTAASQGEKPQTLPHLMGHTKLHQKGGGPFQVQGQVSLGPFTKGVHGFPRLKIITM